MLQNFYRNLQLILCIIVFDMLVMIIAALGRFPVLEIHSMGEGRRDSQARAGSPPSLSFSPHSSANLSPASDEKRDCKTSELAKQRIVDPQKEATNTSKKVRQSYISSCSHTGDESAKKSILLDKGSNSSCIGVDSEKTTGPTEKVNYSSCPLKKFRTGDGVQLHSMGSDSTEAAILDLEELANKIKWLKGLLEFGGPVSNAAARPSWKFVERHTSSVNK